MPILGLAPLPLSRDCRLSEKGKVTPNSDAIIYRDILLPTAALFVHSLLFFFFSWTDPLFIPIYLLLVISSSLFCSLSLYIPTGNYPLKYGLPRRSRTA